MKRYYFIVVIGLFIGALLFQQLLSVNSYLLIVIGDTSIEMSLWLALGLLSGGFLSVWFVFKLAGGSLLLLQPIRKALLGSEERQQKLMADGLVNYIEGNWAPALNLLKRTAPKSRAPLLNYIAGAHSAYELGDEKQAHELLAKADQSTAGAELAVNLSQARIQLRSQKFEQCVATLERVRRIAPKHPVVLELLQESYIALQDWSALEKILPQLEKYRIVKAEKLTQLQQTLSIKLLQGQNTTEDSLVDLKQTWNSLANKWQHETEVVLVYCEELLKLADTETAEMILRVNLHKNWDDRLIEQYGTSVGFDVHRQLIQVETWLKERPSNATLLLAAGRLALHNQLWGKARDYFSSSLKVKGSPGAYAEMARLLAHLGEHERSTEYYQQGLLLFSGVLPKLPMPEQKKTLEG
jgi:HemY protein